MIFGSLDGLATVDEVEASKPLFPNDVEFILINHAQFVWYGTQAGDNEALISYEEQYEQIVDGVIKVGSLGFRVGNIKFGKLLMI